MMGEIWKDECDQRGVLDRLSAHLKLTFIICCYALTFLTIVQFGVWLANVPSFGSIIVPTDIITWLEEKYRHGVWWEMVTSALTKNIALILLFWGQHTLMSQRILEGTQLWIKIHYVYKIDRPFYIMATGIVMQTMIRMWTPVPVVLWSIPWIRGWFVYVHIVAWIIFYGTTLMLDLPDMAGFNQVIVSSPTVTQKSPDLQLMFRVQRHMGFLPFVLVLLIHPLMTLDRLLLSLFILTYSFTSWRSEGCYEYASRMKQMKRCRL